MSIFVLPVTRHPVFGPLGKALLRTWTWKMRPSPQTEPRRICSEFWGGRNPSVVSCSPEVPFSPAHSSGNSCPRPALAGLGHRCSLLARHLAGPGLWDGDVCAAPVWAVEEDCCYYRRQPKRIRPSAGRRIELRASFSWMVAWFDFPVSEGSLRASAGAFRGDLAIAY